MYSLLKIYFMCLIFVVSHHQQKVFNVNFFPNYSSEHYLKSHLIKIKFFVKSYLLYSTLNTYWPQVVAMSCLFLAGKVEETPKKSRDILKQAMALLSDHQFAKLGSDPRVKKKAPYDTNNISCNMHYSKHTCAFQCNQLQDYCYVTAQM